MIHFIFALSLFIAFSVFIYFLCRIAAPFVGQISLLTKKSRLVCLPFVHKIVFGHGYQYVGNRSFFADGDMTIVVGLNGIPSGVIGIMPGWNYLAVYQLQGIEKGNFVGTVSAGDYLLSCAEQIADVLGKKYLKLLPASENFYYPYNDYCKSIEVYERRQSRLRQMYDVTAEQRGYTRKSKSWWIKRL